MDVKLTFVAGMLALLSGAAVAQQMPIDGSRPPTISVAEASRPAAQGGFSSAVAAQIGGTAQSADAAPSATAGPGIVNDVLGNSAVPPTPRKTYRAPAPVLTVEPGKNQLFGVAIGHINRIVTPFARPSLRTTSTASTSIEGSIVYVATPTEDPIGLFIFDEAAPEMAISLTLMPNDIEPVSTTIQVAGWSGTAMASRRPGAPAQALAYEGRHPYLETLTVMLRDIAQGNVPDGYGFEAVDNGYVPGSPQCQIPGVQVRAMQVIVGGAFKTIVAKATNTSIGHVDVREELCKGGDLRAVAAWPRTSLAPGQSTELYLVVGSQTDDRAIASRPSLLGAQ